MSKGYRKMGSGPAGGNMGNMRNQIQQLQQQMIEEQEKLSETEVTATVGGGVLKISMTGDQKCTKVEIDPEFLKDAEVDMLQDMILSGINSALEQSKKMQEDKMSSLTGGLNLSGLGLGF